MVIKIFFKEFFFPFFAILFWKRRKDWIFFFVKKSFPLSFLEGFFANFFASLIFLNAFLAWKSISLCKWRMKKDVRRHKCAFMKSIIALLKKIMIEYLIVACYRQSFVIKILSLDFLSATGWNNFYALFCEAPWNKRTKCRPTIRRVNCPMGFCCVISCFLVLYSDKTKRKVDCFGFASCRKYKSLTGRHWSKIVLTTRQLNERIFNGLKLLLSSISDITENLCLNRNYSFGFL